MLNLRHHYIHPDGHAIELRAFTHGLQPRSVPSMMMSFSEDWQQFGVDAWNAVPNRWCPETGDTVGWWALPEYLGDQFIAPMLNAAPGTCIMMPNVHHIMAALLSCPESNLRGRRIVTTGSEFPSVLHTLQRWKDVYGYELLIVSSTQDGFTDENAVLEAISTTTAVVVLSHVGFASGERLTDAFLTSVAARCRDVNALFWIDGYHATGAFQIDVERYDVDVYFGGLLKLAGGSSGNAYLYVRPGLNLRPRLSGWFGGAEPFGFHIEPQDYPDVRRRFMGGTPAVASLYHSVEGLRILLEAGLDRVREDSLAKTDQAVKRVDELGLLLRSPRERSRRGAMVILEVDSADRLCAYLKSQNIFTDSRRSRLLRMAPFVWNTGAEIDRTFEVIAFTIQTGAHLMGTVDPPAGPVT